MTRIEPGEKQVATNRKAYHDYFILEKLEAGIVLLGTEVKSAREGRINLKDSYAVVRQGEPFLLNCHISPYSHGNRQNHEPTRTRKLLLHGAELARLIGKVERSGYTLVPVNLHYAKGRIKADIGLAKGKKQHDKREVEKERDWLREKQRLMRNKA